MSRSEGGAVVWITGVSGAGKTALGEEVSRHLRAGGHHVVFLDGDRLREVFGPLGLSSGTYVKSARAELAMMYARLCRELAGQGSIVVIATISLFASVHEWNRAHLPRYVEVFLDVDVSELRVRDPKGLYKRYFAGELEGMVGLDVEAEIPATPDVWIKIPPHRSVVELAETVLAKITEVTTQGVADE